MTIKFYRARAVSSLQPRMGRENLPVRSQRVTNLSGRTHLVPDRIRAANGQDKRCRHGEHLGRSVALSPLNQRA